jgi:hypothetical protein
LMI